MHILQLEIANLRAISRLKLDLRMSEDRARRRLIIVGGNGSGKTTILSAISHLFAQETSARGAVKLDAGDVRMRPSRESAGAVESFDLPLLGRLSMDMYMTSQERSAMADRDHSSDIPRTFSLQDLIGEPSSFRLFLEAVQRLRDKGLLKGVEKGTEEHNEKESEPRVEAKKVLDRISTPACVFLPADRGTMSDFEDVFVGRLTQFEPREGCLTDDRSRFRIVPSLLALAFVAPRRNDPEGVIARMWKVIAKYFPEMPKPVDVHGLRMLFETADGTIVSLPQLSDGQRAILLIMGELALRNPAHGVVLIDEIEQHLHPRWQRAILDALMALLPDAQFILTSQAPYIAASAPDDVVTIGDWERDGQ
jgi:predicted ATPase